MTPVCTVCDQPIDGDAHFPHDEECPKSSQGWGIGWPCQCDNATCPACCWEAGCKETT